MKSQILQLLRDKPGQKASEIALILGVDRRVVSRCLERELAGQVLQQTNYRWQLVEPQSAAADDSAAHKPELARLCNYYLECIDQDMDEGASTFAANRQGTTNYAALEVPPWMPGVAWWNDARVAHVLGQVRQDSANLVAWLGYPVRLRHHQTAKWEGYFVEPVMLWPIEIPDRAGEPPRIAWDVPTPNGKFLKSVTLGDNMQLAEEAARLSEELGLNAPPADMPELEELVERLFRIRPDWDWREPLDPTQFSAIPPIAELNQAGIYNRAVVLPGKRSPFTQGLEAELKILVDAGDSMLAGTALGSWLHGTAQTPPSTGADPLIEVLPMNTEQRAAVQAALDAPLTVVTGPPGTGKSQVVTNLLVNAAWRDMKVLFASKNNKAVDVVEGRVNGLGNRPVLLRLGKQYESRLGEYLSQMLAGAAGEDERIGYEESLDRHKELAARLTQLIAVRQATLDARNTVDRLDAEAQEARDLLGAEVVAGLNEERLKAAELATRGLEDAIGAADVRVQSLFTRLAWPLLAGDRLRALGTAWEVAASAWKPLCVPNPVPSTPEPLDALRAAVQASKYRIDLAQKILSVRRALVTLQASPSFEEISEQAYKLTQQVSQNSNRLWRDWVQLAPTRLTAAQRRDVADYAALLAVLSGPDAQTVPNQVRQQARRLQAQVTGMFSCWAVTSLSAKGRIPLEPGYFDLVVIDEASQCDIASALPLLYRAKRAVIIGDPMQLRHISGLSPRKDSELQIKHGLLEGRATWMYSVRSLFDVAAATVQPGHIINLRDHHRSHSDIITFANQTFYEGRLRVATRYGELTRPNKDQPGVQWEDVKGKTIRPRDGGATNPIEAKALVDALVDLLVTRGYPGTVGVVTPFRAQAQLLQEMVSKRAELASASARAELLVDTVHRFQGDERDVMFFSPVIGEGAPAGALGFLRQNGNLFNVAITRARSLLHVVGDQAYATTCGIDYLEQFARYVGQLRHTGMATNTVPPSLSSTYPKVARPEQVSEWERLFYQSLYSAGLRPIPQFSVDQYDLDFALIVGDRRLNVEVDGERYHRTWTGELCMRDQLRNQRLIELGWEIKRFWVYEIRDEPESCVKWVRDWAEAALLA